jgi:hypothetical protein
LVIKTRSWGRLNDYFLERSFLPFDLDLLAFVYGVCSLVASLYTLLLFFFRSFTGFILLLIDSAWDWIIALCFLFVPFFKAWCSMDSLILSGWTGDRDYRLPLWSCSNLEEPVSPSYLDLIVFP